MNINLGVYKMDIYIYKKKNFQFFNDINLFQDLTNHKENSFQESKV